MNGATAAAGARPRCRLGRCPVRTMHSGGLLCAGYTDDLTASTAAITFSSCFTETLDVCHGQRGRAAVVKFSSACASRLRAVWHEDWALRRYRLAAAQLERTGKGTRVLTHTTLQGMWTALHAEMCQDVYVDALVHLQECELHAAAAAQLQQQSVQILMWSGVTAAAGDWDTAARN